MHLEIFHFAVGQQVAAGMRQAGNTVHITVRSDWQAHYLTQGFLADSGGQFRNAAVGQVDDAQFAFLVLVEAGCVFSFSQASGIPYGGQLPAAVNARQLAAGFIRQVNLEGVQVQQIQQSRDRLAQIFQAGRGSAVQTTARRAFSAGAAALSCCAWFSRTETGSIFFDSFIFTALILIHPHAFSQLSRPVRGL